MKPRSVIEIAQSDGRLPTELIVVGYWASQAGVVVYVLNGVTPQAINLVLDPIVTTLPLSIPGVLYVSINDTTRVCEAVRCAEEIYATTKVFRRQAIDYGIAPDFIRPVATAIPRLENRTLLSEQNAPASQLVRPHVVMPFPASNWVHWAATDRTAQHAATAPV